MPRMKTTLVVTAFSAACLAIGIGWTVLVDAPLRLVERTPEAAKLRIEVWEPEQDMATVSMSLPKKPIDTMLAFGLDPKIEVDHRGTLRLKQLLRDAQALPPGKQLVYREYDATMYVWVDPGDGSAPSTARPGGVERHL